MANIKKLYFANGTDVTAPTDLSFPATVYANDAAYIAANGPATDGDFYLNSTLKALRVYSGGAWRTTIMATDATDATKLFGVDLSTATSGTSATIRFSNTTNKVYTFPDIEGTVVLTVGDQTVDGKTLTNAKLNQPKITGGTVDVETAGNLTVGGSIGANNLTLAGATSTVIIPGNLTVQGTTTSVDSINLDVKDKNITVNNGGSDASSEGAGLTVDRVGADGSIIYKDSAPNKFAAGAIGLEKNLAAIDDISVTNLTGVLPPSKGGTGVANNDAATITRVGNHAVSLTTTGPTNLTLPTTGTLATTADIGASGVTGPAVSDVNRVALWNNSTGSLLKNSLVEVINDTTVSAGEFTTSSIFINSNLLQTKATSPDLIIIPHSSGIIQFQREPVSYGALGFSLKNSTNTFKSQILPSNSMTANRQVTLPDASGEVVLTTGQQNLASKTLVEPVVDNFQAFNHESTPAQALAGTIRVFAKNDNKLYTIDSSGVESQIGSGGTTDRVTQANAGFSIGDVLYLNGSIYTKAIATSAAASEVVGVVSKIIDSNAATFTFEITLSGEITGLSGLTAGEVYFLSPSSAGVLTTTEPTTIGQVSVPVGVASSSTSLYVAPKRGVVVGGTNARAQVSLTSAATTNVQNVGTYDAGELTGWVFISSAAPVRFYLSAKFAKSGSGGDYNLSYSTTGDTPPAGFLVDITTTGIIRVTLPASSGSTSVINYALNAPAIGASFPLTVNADTILSGTVDDERLPDPTTYTDAKATKLGLKQYIGDGSTQYAGGNTITLGGSGVVVRRAVFIPYQVQDGSWRLRFNFYVACNSTTSLALTITGILAKNVSNYFQALSGFPGGNYGRAYISPNTNIITMTSDLSTGSMGASGDIELESKPTWAY